MKIRYLGPFGKQSGYAEAGHRTLMALQQVGVDLDIQPIMEFDAASLDDQYKPLLASVEKRSGVNWPDVVIVHCPPFGLARYVTDDLKPNGRVKRIAMTTWESDRLRPDIGKEIKENFDLIAVPSKHNEVVFSRFQETIVVPHPYDPTLVRPGHENTSGRYRFLYVGAWNYRKNPAGLVKAYLATFKANDPVELIIKTSGAHVQGAIDSIKRSLQLESYPEITLITEPLSSEEMARLYRRTDCFVSFHRGEGFGLGMFEAKCHGRLVVATNYGGNLDFMSPADDFIGFMFTFASVPEELILEPGAARISRIDPTGLTAEQMWAEPDLLNGAKCMANAWQTDSHTDPFYDRIIRKFSYEQVAQDFLKAIQ